MFALTFLAVTVAIAGRSYIIHVPAQLPKNAPLVIALHGAGSNAANQQRWSGMDSFADREKFVVVYPNGTGTGDRLVWNAGTCCGNGRVDDVAFIRAVVDHVAKRVSIDRKRVYATGMSNGAMMTYRLAAEAPDLVAAIAPVAGFMVLSAFRSARPVPIIHFHSVDDSMALYDEDRLQKWIRLNGCRTTPVVEKRLVGKAGTDEAGNTATKLVYAPCTSGSNVVLWKLTGAGHVWPGSPIHSAGILGRSTQLIDANEEMWRFFKAR